MALKVVTATFTGAEDSIAVTWPGVGAQHSILVGTSPSDGFGAVSPWLTSHAAGGATVNVSERWQGTITLTVVDNPNGIIRPTTPSSFAFRGAFPIPYSLETNGGTPTVYTRAFYVPSDVAAVTPKIRNAWQSGAVGALTSNIALCTSDGSGGAGTNLQTWLAQTIPGSGDWSGGSTPITRGSDGKIVLLQSLAAAASVACAVTPLVHGTYSAGTSTVNPAPGVSGSDPTPITWNHFDYVTNRPRFVFITDSIGCGVNTTIGFENSFPYQVGVSKNYAIAQLSLPGSSLAQWADFAGVSASWWADGVFNTGAGVWIQLGVNDVAGNPAANLEASITAIVNHLRNDLGVTNIYANTIAPNGSTNEPTRTGYNAWLLANSLGLTAVADFAKKQNVGGLADNSTATSLFASYDSGDHLHWTDAGQNAAAALVQATV